MFERLETLQDVLPHISYENGISVSDRGDFTVVNYQFTTDGTFANRIARECRGLKFDPDGWLIARPFHKFFNLGEKRPPEAEAWDSPHTVMDKLDGSMVHPCPVAGELRLMTRGGLSPQAMAAEQVASAGVLSLCCDMVAAGMTPVFEFTSPDHRIVLAYDRPDLTLLAVRDITTGDYLPQAELVALGTKYDVPIVQIFDGVADLKAFMAQARGLDGREGYVVAFASGERVKLKADAYVLRHKALSALSHEKNVLAMVTQQTVDDVLPLLAPDVAARLSAYADSVMRGLAAREAEIEAFVTSHAGLARKAFAQTVQAELDRRFHAVAFRRRDGTPVRAGLIEVLQRAAQSDTRVETLRDLIGTTWASDGLLGGSI